MLLLYIQFLDILLLRKVVVPYVVNNLLDNIRMRLFCLASGVSAVARTRDPRLRRAMLYPTELRKRCYSIANKTAVCKVLNRTLKTI